MRRFAAILAALLATQLGLAARAAADPPYPATLPDFAHRAHPHQVLYSPVGGNLDRPVLVIRVHFSDRTPEPGQTDAWLAERFFGGGSALSVAGWYREQSFNHLRVFPARERFGARDGVVSVTAGTAASFFTPADIRATDSNELDRLRSARMIRRALELADPYVDFNDFDDSPTADHDGWIQNNELIVEVLWDASPGQGGGAVRRSEEFRLDGKTIRLDASLEPVTTDLMTLVHETGHELTYMRDFYGFGVGNWALAGTSGGEDDGVRAALHGASAYEKTHLGWITPTVVVRDGYYTVRPAHSTPQAFILYDPQALLGHNNYFMVENRVPAAGSYDQAVPDSGLLIWRVADLSYNSGREHIRPLEIMRPDGMRTPGCVDADVDGREDEDPPDLVDNDGDLRIDEDGGDGRDNDGDGRVDEDWPDGRDNDVPPDGRIDEEDRGGGCYGGDTGDAWNAADPSTSSARAMSRPWADGTASRVAVRAIERPAPDGSIRAFFDVRGQFGVLVDCFSPGTGVRSVRAGEPNTYTFPIRNTGEAADTFHFSIDVPGGWTASAPVTRALAAGEEGLVGFTVTPPRFAVDQPYSVNLTAASTTAGRPGSSCSAPLQLSINRTRVTYTGLTRAPWGEPAGFRVQVRDDVTGTPVSGAYVTFRLIRAFNVVLEAAAITDGTGVAFANPRLDLTPSTYDLLDIEVGRVGPHAAASDSGLYTILRRTTRTIYNGDWSGDYSDPAVLAATVLDASTGSPLAGREVRFALGPQSIIRPTGSDGVASGAIVIAQPAGNTSVSVWFTADELYESSADGGTFAVTKEAMARFGYTGDSVTTSSSPHLEVFAEEEPDGSPGNIDLAGLSFTAAGLLGGTTTTVGTADVDANGRASIFAIDLPPDVYTVGVAAPAANAHWEGSAPDAAELVVYDPSRFAYGKGNSDSGKPVGFEFLANYDGGTPSGFAKAEIEGGTFTSDSLHWIVAQDDRAVLQAAGEYEGEPATLRIRVRDAADPGVGTDTFRLEVAMADVTLDSGVVVLDYGEIAVGTTTAAP